MESSAPGNIFFSGEHAVVYGNPALIASVGRRAFASAARIGGDSVVVFSKELGTASMNHGVKTGPLELHVLLDMVKEVAGEGVQVRIRSDIPPESGMSSSTAVLTAVLDALNKELELGIKKQDYRRVLLPYQERIHGGKASGSEFYSSVFGGMHLLEKKENKLTAKEIRGVQVPVVIASTRVRAPTSLTVKYHVPSMIDRYPEKVERAWDEIREVTLGMERALKDKDFYRLGELATLNHNILKELGVSHPKLDDCVQEALKAGALGAKMSGAGWGGIMFAVCMPEDQEKVARALARTRVDVIKTKVGVQGVGENVQGY